MFNVIEWYDVVELAPRNSVRSAWFVEVFYLSICSHVLEHVPDPASAATKNGRISKRGYLETPAYGKDVLVGTGHQHIRQVVSDNDLFHFFSYTQRQNQAHADSPLMSIWCGNRPQEPKA